MFSIILKIYLIALHTSLAGMLWGLDAGSIGLLTQMTQFRNSIGYISSGQLGIYIACIQVSAAISSLCSGHVADAMSRKYGIATGGLIVTVGTIISASANNLPALICARLITGIGHGQSLSLMTIYVCEIAPHDIRGTVATILQLSTTIGVVTGYFIAYGTSILNSSLAWRGPFIVQACIAVMLSIGMTFLPFSPRWLVQRGRFQEARQVLLGLRRTESVEEELQGIKWSLEDKGMQRATFSEVFSKRYIRRSLLGIFLMGFEMFSGMTVVLYYAPILFTQAGFSSKRASFLASAISGVVNVVFTIPSQIWMDKWGRRFPLIGGGIAMASCFLAIGSIYAAHGGKANGEIYLSGKASQWAVIILIYIFVANFSWSWAVVIKIYACEIVPTHLRGKACAFQHLANLGVNFMMALTGPLFLRASPSGPYFLFSAATYFVAVVCYFFMPETKGKSLEEIQVVFEKNSAVQQVVSVG